MNEAIKKKELVPNNKNRKNGDASSLNSEDKTRQTWCEKWKRDVNIQMDELKLIIRLLDVGSSVRFPL